MLLKTSELREHMEGSFVDLRLQHDMPGTMSHPRENSAFSSYPASFLFLLVNETFVWRQSRIWYVSERHQRLDPSVPICPGLKCGSHQLCSGQC